MPLLLLCVALQALSLSQGFNETDDRTSKSVKKHAESDKQIELSTLSLSEGCFGVPRALYKNTTVDVTLNLLDDQEKKDLALQICERLSCGGVYKHGMSATVHNGTCLADCILRDSKLHNCTTAAKGDCRNATQVICEHQAVQLVGGSDRCAGRVELLHSGKWGTVCDDDFDNCSQRLVCAQLRCGSPIREGFFGPGTGPIYISQMKCNGSESSLWECDSIKTTASNYCGHKEDAGVVCSESMEKPVTHTTGLNLTALVPVSTAVAATESNSGISAAAIGCIILSIALLMVIILNAAAFVHFKRAKECVIYQHHTNSHSSLESQSNVQMEYYNTQTRGQQYESLGPRMSSKYGSKISMRTNPPTHDSGSSTDSDYEYHDTNRPQRLHLNNSRDVKDMVSTSSGEKCVHNVEINMDTIQNSAVDMNDTSSTTSGEFYQNTKTDMSDTLQSPEETPALQETLPLTLLSYGDHHLPGTDNKGIDMNDSSSTSSGEFYQNTETNTDNNFISHVNDSDSTSSGECYQNTEINMDKDLQCEDEESPSPPQKSLKTPHSAQMSGNAAGYSGTRVPVTHSQDGNDSDSTSSEECYQNTEMDENAYHHYGEESPSLPEMSFQNPHIAQMTEGTDGYGDHHEPRNLSQETDNSSTVSEVSYVNVPPKKESEDNYAASSESDYDEPEA
ncbi:T-cell differentiation antigen CD6-like isoform X4 [Carassius carassius]|uniref:T-cell differentiation antigen CD6-like isoform X4 n=1 Tax=Carassius carassius TaxID=217509 RepID=UPI00286943F4|nr:T-cell differentiation antigen CD6-like isoform X4 [Carassius carassius]